jgi:chemotaxis protein CheD
LTSAVDIIDIFLQPGEYFVGDADFRIRTLLGSCVSITLWHPKRRIGAMSHFLLSKRLGGARTELDARYGEEAMDLILRELRLLKVDPAECQAKVFGGGNMFPQHTRRMEPNVGQRNGETARSLLRTHGIALMSESLYGVGHRQIIFEVTSGNVWVRQIKPSPPMESKRPEAE